MNNNLFNKRLFVPVLVLLITLFGSTALANHSWGNYHWARTANPFNLKLGDNVSSAWDARLASASSDWSQSAVLDTSVVAGSTSPKTCQPKAGRVEVCNSKYGNNGWLGVASIWVNSTSHITRGTVKLNDTYFNTAKYNTIAWRNFVMCQEIGHTFGLDHQDENFTNANLGSCMDYTNNPSSNQHPNQHDYDQLAAIYAHLDSTTTLASAISRSALAYERDSENESEWGKVVRKSKDGKPSLYEKDLGKGQKVFTFVIWAE